MLINKKEAKSIAIALQVAINSGAISRSGISRRKLFSIAEFVVRLENEFKFDVVDTNAKPYFKARDRR